MSLISIKYCTYYTELVTMFTKADLNLTPVTFFGNVCVTNIV